MIHLCYEYKTDAQCSTPGSILRYHRTFKGLTTRQLAEQVGIVPATLILYENDKNPIKYDTAVALAERLNIDRSCLLDEYTRFIDYPCGELLRNMRKQFSFTQDEISSEIGVSQTAYSGWERGIKKPRRQEYEKILVAIKKHGIDVTELFKKPEALHI